MKSKKTGPEKQQDKGSTDQTGCQSGGRNIGIVTSCLMIPDKDEKVYFNVDLTEPDEVYELTGYQESKLKVRISKFFVSDFFIWSAFWEIGIVVFERVTGFKKVSICGIFLSLGLMIATKFIFSSKNTVLDLLAYWSLREANKLRERQIICKKGSIICLTYCRYS